MKFLQIFVSLSVSGCVDMLNCEYFATLRNFFGVEVQGSDQIQPPILKRFFLPFYSADHGDHRNDLLNPQCNS